MGPPMSSRAALDGSFVEEGLPALGGHTDGGAQGHGRDAQHAAAGAKEHLHRLVGEDLLRGAGGLEGVLDGGSERLAVERLEVDLDGDARERRAARCCM